jgi:DNA-binding transcriptional LysR family regulator
MDRHLALRCFCRVVETGSFAAAARDMDCSRSVVTKYVQYLEEWTASRLLERTTRTMHVTEAGERFYAYCRRVMADTEQTLGALTTSKDTLTGRLVIASPVSLTLSLLSEHFHAFQAMHPGLELELRLNDRAVDLVREGIDVALRGQAQLEDSSLVAAPLMVFHRVVCAAPAYWQRAGKPTHPSDLHRLNCLPYLLGSDATNWLFDGADGRHNVPATGNFRADNSLLLIDALLRGVGVSLVPEPMVRSHLQAGRLEAALTGYRTESRSLHAIYPSREHLPQKVRSFVRFMKERLAGSPN